MKRLLIGVVSRPDIVDEIPIQTIMESVRLWILKGGAIPYVILPTQDRLYYNDKESILTEYDKEILDQQIEMCDGIIMPRWT